MNWRFTLKMKLIHSRLFTIFAGALLLAVLVFAGDTLLVNSKTDNSEGFILTKPAFAQSNAASFLMEEAGISAWINTGQTIDPSRARNIFKIIEAETSEYFIGLVSVEPDGEDLNDYYTHDIHAFIHKDGCIVTYYLKSEPVGKMIGHKYYMSNNLNNNYLVEGLTKLGSSLGISTLNPQYYHFQYPGANRITKIAGENFKLKIPDSFQVYEVSFAGQHSVWFDYKTIDPSGSEKYGNIGISNFNTGIIHEISVSNSIVILYKE